VTGGKALNIHATAIRIGQRGILFTGRSGAGKSMMAFHCLATARRQNVACALVADDQVFMTIEGGRMIATCPPNIAGMLELRGSGIVRIDHVASAAIDLAVQVVSLADDERLPPADETFPVGEIGSLPLVRIAGTAPDPLAMIGALVPAWREEVPFW
jgi:serine kinase of HPr protein (carbohydrate metabolism regulator)